MNKTFVRVVWMATALVVVAGGNLFAAQFVEINTYDFSDNANATWTNYCAPTAAADTVYHFGVTYASLVQGNLYGPGNQPGADNGVTDIIGGRNPPNGADPPGGNGPTAGTLAARMSTTRSGGTTLDNLQAGLDAYLEANDGDANITWDTQELLAAGYANQPGLSLFNALQTALSGGADVILAIAWQNGLPGDPYEVPEDYDGGVLGFSAIGHAVEMIGYDNIANTISVNDPANNAGVHSWVAEATVCPVQGLVNNFQIVLGGKLGTIYGAVTTQPVPEPSTLLLLAMGAAGLATAGIVRFARSRRQEA